MNNEIEKQDAVSEILSESALGKTLDINNLNYSIPFLKSYTTTNPIIEETVQNNESNNEWWYPTFDVSQSTPIEASLPDYSRAPGFWENFKHTAARANSLVQTGEFALDTIRNNASTDEIVPDNWTAMRLENVDGFPEQYWSYITDARGPHDLLMRQEYARKQMQQDEKFAQGGLFSTLLGGLAGTLTDPMTYLIPMASGVKYTTLTSNVARNLLKAQPGLAVSSVMTAGLEQANRIGGNLSDMAKNAAIDYAYGNVLMGIGFGTGFGKDALSRSTGLTDLMKIVPKGYKVDLETAATKEGGIAYTGNVVLTPMSGMAMNAQKVAADTVEANNVMAQSGLFNTFVGKPLEKALGWGFLASPVMKAANSGYSSVRGFFNRIAPVTIRTTGEMLGNAVPFTAHEIASFIKDSGRSLNLMINEKFMEANGVLGGHTLKGAIKLAKAQFDNNLNISREQFGKESILRAVQEGYVSKCSQANEVGDAMADFLKGLGERYTKASGSDMFLDPRNAWRYFPMNYWVEAIRNNESGFVSTVANAYKKQDETISLLREPLERHEANVKSLKLEIKNLKETNKADRRIRDFENRLALEEKNLQIANDKLIQQLRDNKNLHKLLDDRVYFNSEETKKLNEYKKPIQDAEEKLNNQKEELKFAQDRLKETNKQIKSLKKRKNPTDKQKEDLAFLKDEKISLEREVEVQQGRVDRIEDEYNFAVNELEDLARNGKIDKKYFREYGNKIVFHEPKLPKFRETFADDTERELHAKALMESIYNESPSDLLANVFGDQEPGVISNPHYRKSRKVMIDQHELIDFLDPDIGKTINNYASVMGKITGIKEAIPELAQGPAMEGFMLNFKLEHDAKKAALEEELKAGKFTDKQAQSKRAKLDKEFVDNQKFMKDTLDTYFGVYASNKNPVLRKTVTGLKNLVSSSILGAVPLYGVQELSGLLMKQGLMPFISQGLGPAFRNIAKPVTDEEKRAYREMAAHAFMGMNNCFMGYTNRFIDSNEMSYPPVNSAAENFGRATEKIAAVSNSLFGTNMVQNLEEQLVANAGQSEIMSWCYKFKDGTITDIQRQKAARYGIDLENDADVFIKNYENTPGTWKSGDGYMSLYHRWEDVAAVNKMTMSMRRMVQDQVVQANKFTSPYWAQNEFLSSFFMFHGWAYGYLTRYAIPFMQRPDAEQALGLMMMTSLGMGIEATKRFMNGKEMWDDDKQWHTEALKSLLDSGMIAGPYWQWANEFNNFFGVFPNFGTERFQDRRGFGQFSPIFGYLEKAGRFTKHLSKGDLTQGDVKGGLSLFPIASSHLLFRHGINNILKNSSLPEKRSQAESWSIYGEQ